MFVDEAGILSINPKPTLKNGKLTVKEGETIGPYSCSADCNPACEIKWIYKDIGDNVTCYLQRTSAEYPNGQQEHFVAPVYSNIRG